LTVREPLHGRRRCGVARRLRQRGRLAGLRRDWRRSLSSTLRCAFVRFRGTRKGTVWCSARVSARAASPASACSAIRARHRASIGASFMSARD
jgi:hypothetical protein